MFVVCFCAVAAASQKKRYICFTPAPPSQPMQTAVLPSGVAAVAAAVATAAAAAAEGEVLPASEVRSRCITASRQLTVNNMRQLLAACCSLA